ncbi:MAG: hypothetical protein IKB07_09500 [Lachnospiraceae bacterium]|nr:hypothetical protein [Lachnospiraceae bacterium]
MRIYITEASRKILNLRIPLGLAINRMTAGFIARRCRKEGIHISKGQLRVLIKEVKKYKKHHKNWKLVEIDSADGAHVEIVL